MTNFIFKSHGTFKTICNKLEIIQSELRHQRSDNVMILSLLNKLTINLHLQEQANEYFEQSKLDEEFIDTQAGKEDLD